MDSSFFYKPKTSLKQNIKYEENTRVMERRGGSRNIALFTSKPKKTPNMKFKYGHKHRRYEEKTELEKMSPETATIFHPKTPNNMKRSNNT